jgi:hypothetical protein
VKALAADIGKRPLKRIDLNAGEMIEFEVMIRPIETPAALGEEMGNRIGPQPNVQKPSAAASPDFVAF